MAHLPAGVFDGSRACAGGFAARADTRFEKKRKEPRSALEHAPEDSWHAPTSEGRRCTVKRTRSSHRLLSSAYVSWHHGGLCPRVWCSRRISSAGRRGANRAIPIGVVRSHRLHWFAAIDSIVTAIPMAPWQFPWRRAPKPSKLYFRLSRCLYLLTRKPVGLIHEAFILEADKVCF